VTGVLQSFSGVAVAGQTLAAPRSGGMFVQGLAPKYDAAKVELYQNGRQVGSVGVSASGRWTIGHLLPGKYAVRAFDGYDYTAMQEVELKEGEVQTVGFAFDPLPEKSVFAFPNPAHQRVTLRFLSSLTPLEAQISVFDAAGRLVRELDGSQMSSPAPGLYHADWDLSNGAGQSLASGVYLYMVKVRGGPDNESAKVIKKLAVVR
jgi:hypothetical protein